MKGFLFTFPTVPGSHSKYPLKMFEGYFPSTAIDGGSESFVDGGGELQAFTSAAKTTQLAVDIKKFVVGGTPDIEINIETPTAETGSTVYIVKDDVQTSQPVVTALYGRNNAYSEYAAVYRMNEASGTLEDITGNGH
ncbi:MAG: hypothetical protein GY941_07565, partial [Planctomycetes bacterium]|nr:hypothetical protein [Planctomycetota bacterium]